MSKNWGLRIIKQQTGSHSGRPRLPEKRTSVSSINRGRPKFSNLNCGEMVCNDVKYCLEKDADSYYGRAGSEPFNLKPPGPGACKKMLTRQFHCQSVTVAREYFRAHPFFYPPSRFPWLPPSTNIIISWHEFSRVIFRVFFVQNADR